MNKIYDFESVNETPVMTPMSHLFCKRIMDRFKKDMKGKIIKNNCYENAILAAKWFNERGFDVQVVDGWYHLNEEDDKLSRRLGDAPRDHTPEEHRFCKRGDKYFDPTIELVWGDIASRFGVVATRLYDYTALRVYDLETITDFTQTVQEYYGYDGILFSTITGRCMSHSAVTGDYSFYFNPIDENGHWTPPEVSPIEAYKQHYFKTVAAAS